MPASALDKVNTFAGEMVFERNLPTSIKPEAALAYQVKQEYQKHKTRKRKHHLFFQFDKNSLEFSKQIGDDGRFDQGSCTGKDRNSRILPCATLRFRDSC